MHGKETERYRCQVSMNIIYNNPNEKLRFIVAHNYNYNCNINYCNINITMKIKRFGIPNFFQTNRYIILEKAKGLGGTWRENIYPGVACDIPSHFYSYSFFPNPNWSREYSTGREIFNYLNEVRFK